MLSKATGTTPSLQDNKGRRDAIIPHQLLTVYYCEKAISFSHEVGLDDGAYYDAFGCLNKH